MALAEELLAAVNEGQDPAALAERLVAAAPDEARAALGALGRSRSARAGPILAAVAEGRANAARDLRKEARRELHRLRAVGVEVPRPSALPAVAPHPPLAERPAVLADAWASAADGVGSRVLWLTAERQHGGIYGVGLVLNDIVGMKACTVDDTTRKRFTARFEGWRAEAGVAVVPIPLDYAPQLVGEALELNRASGFTVPREWLMHRRALAALAAPFEEAVIYREIPAAEVALTPDLLAGSPALLEEPELAGWFFGFDEVRRFALDLRQARQSQIVLGEELRTQRIQRILVEAIRAVVTPPIQRGLRRRLEEVAYLFVKTGRGRQARLAVAAARRLADGSVAPHPLLEGTVRPHPLLVAMMEKSLEFALQAETAGVPTARVRRGPYDPIE